MLNSPRKATIIAGLICISFTTSASNLLLNPSFEEPGAKPPEECLGSPTTWYTCPDEKVTGWKVFWTDPTPSTDAGILEFQTSAVVASVPHGTYKVELASHNRDGQKGTLDNRVTIEQTVNNLCSLDNYTLSFQNRQRQSNDILTVSVGDDIKGTYTNSDWTTDTISITNATSAKISFAETGPAGTLGSLLDDVSLTNDSGSTSCILDAKPQSNPNAVNICKSGGVVPVAFVGTPGFDPYNYTVNGVVLTGGELLLFGKGKSEACVIEDVVDDTNPEGANNLDGLADLVCHIPTDLFAEMVNVNEAATEVEVCVQLLDNTTDKLITMCASDDLKIAKDC